MLTFGTISLNIQNDCNLQSSHIFCFQETRTKHAQEITQYFDTSKYKYIHIFHKHGLFMVYEKTMICYSFQIKNYSCNIQ
jgi:exonuclease III